MSSMAKAYKRPFQGTRFGTGTRPRRRYPAGRLCKVCAMPLSTYNPTDYCYPDRPRRYGL